MSDEIISGPQPAGFGGCRRCPYRETGAIAVCYSCARATLRPPAKHRCDVCDQALPGPTALCSNTLCRSRERAFEWTAAIAMKTDVLQNMIWKVKFENRWQWGIIFARVILGYLYDHPESTDGLDAIIPTPALLPDGADPRGDHARFAIQQAIEQDERGLPFVVDPPLIVKTRPTPRMRDAARAGGRRDVARNLYQALEVPDPARVRGKQIMVYDDVFTTGNTLNAVARRLKAAGAKGVYGLTLARQPWAGRPENEAR